MEARFRSCWQKIKKHWVAIGVGAIIFVVVIAIILIGYQFDWTRFGGYNKVTTTKEITSSLPKITRTEEYQPGKGLWDWLQLLGVLAIPVVVGLGAAWYTVQQGKVSDRENTDNQRETALQAYIDKMSELLLHEKLRDSAEEDEIRKIARVRTLTILPRLDANRKRSVLQFLYESGLIDNGKWCIVDLDGDNLCGANLSGTDLVRTDMHGAILSGADLSGADLSEANLWRANLSEANLSEANLNEVNLAGTNLNGADLRYADLSETNSKDDIEQLEKQAKSLKGATMPDGSIHP